MVISKSKVKILKKRINKQESKSKINMYYLIAFWSYDELLKGNIYFIDKTIPLSLKKTLSKIAKTMAKENNLIKEETSLKLKSIQKISTDMKRLSFEMMFYFAIDHLIHISRDTTARVSFGHIPTFEILEEIKSKYKVEYLEHIDLFTKIEEQI